ncbi:MAG: ParM/StbA family protein [Balneolales bacterium]
MNIRSISFPSVVEGHNTELVNVAKDQLNGLKVREADDDYIIGNLALSEGRNPHKAINSSPDELDYKLLIKAGILMASNFVKEPMVITTGFPFSTININNNAAKEYISGLESITFDSRSFGGRNAQIAQVLVNRVEVIPELIGGIIAMRSGGTQRTGNFFMVSLGYGTVEIGLSTDGGIVQRTEGTGPGLRYAIDWAMKELMQNYYVGLRTEHQFDTAFQKGSITVNRKRIDLSDIRKRALNHYYKDVVAPLMRNTWVDEDFNRANAIILVGGGAHYPEIVNNFTEEFGGFANIEVPDDPTTVVSRGYCIRSRNIAGADDAAVGIDIGNAHTTVSIFEQN